MTTTQMKTAKRIVAAEGYLELGLPFRALEELFQCDPYDGTYTEAVQSLASEARGQIDRSIGVTVAVMDMPVRTELAELQLADCYRRVGLGSSSANILASARGAK